MSDLWRALADPSRRRILDLLKERARTTGDLAARFPFTRFAMMKHLAVLEEAGLVIVERRGRERINHLNAVPIREIYRRWIRPFAARRADRMLELKRRVESEERPWTSRRSTPEASSSRPASGEARRRSGAR
jgi:DNA-binding transcriptional ArsR family regulator